MSTKSKNRDIASYLSFLQHGDSFFPSGTLAFSCGLESLTAQRKVTKLEELEEFIRSQLWGRWIGLDRPCLVAAHDVSGSRKDISRLIEIDQIVNANTLPLELRIGSIRAGHALLGVHKRMGTPYASDYRELIENGKALGHLPVIQGICWAGSGLNLLDAQLVGVHTLIVGLSSAAIRLGIIGHIDAQNLIKSLQEDIVKILSVDSVEPEDSWCFSPISDIAVMQHEFQDTRLFTN